MYTIAKVAQRSAAFTKCKTFADRHGKCGASGSLLTTRLLRRLLSATSTSDAIASAVVVVALVVLAPVASMSRRPGNVANVTSDCFDHAGESPLVLRLLRFGPFGEKPGRVWSPERPTRR